MRPHFRAGRHWPRYLADVSSNTHYDVAAATGGFGLSVASAQMFRATRRFPAASDGLLLGLQVGASRSTRPAESASSCWR